MGAAKASHRSGPVPPTARRRSVGTRGSRPAKNFFECEALADKLKSGALRDLLVEREFESLYVEAASMLGRIQSATRSFSAVHMTP